MVECSVALSRFHTARAATGVESLTGFLLVHNVTCISQTVAHNAFTLVARAAAGSPGALPTSGKVGSTIFRAVLL